MGKCYSYDEESEADGVKYVKAGIVLGTTASIVALLYLNVKAAPTASTVTTEKVN